MHPDGDTDTPRVRVDPALFRAAQAVKDGQFVPEPVKEGEKFAVVWRRGSLPAKARTVEQERESMQNLLERRRADDAHAALVLKLRAEFVKDEHVSSWRRSRRGCSAETDARARRPFVASAAPGSNCRDRRTAACASDRRCCPANPSQNAEDRAKGALFIERALQQHHEALGLRVLAAVGGALVVLKTSKRCGCAAPPLRYHHGAGNPDARDGHAIARCAQLFVGKV